MLEGTQFSGTVVAVVAIPVQSIPVSHIAQKQCTQCKQFMNWWCLMCLMVFFIL